MLSMPSNRSRAVFGTRYVSTRALTAFINTSTVSFISNTRLKEAPGTLSSRRSGIASTGIIFPGSKDVSTRWPDGRVVRCTGIGVFFIMSRQA